MNRVIAYVDGFNLYYGLKTKRWKRYYWLNIQSLAQKLINPDQVLVLTKYFTARVSDTPREPDKSKRQNTYLEALQTLKDFPVFFGHYLEKPVRCYKCGFTWVSHEEKMSDVNIATELLMDAYTNRFDVALLISADSDLLRPVETVRQLLPQKAVVVGFPPNRSSLQLRQAASASFTISRKKLAESQFPDEVTKPDGYVLRRPDRWR